MKTIPVWFRIGANVELTESEIVMARNGELDLAQIIKERGICVCGESYPCDDDQDLDCECATTLDEFDMVAK